MWRAALVLSCAALAASTAAPRCHASFNNATQLETPCYTVVKQAPSPAGSLELRRYAGAAATVVACNASATITTYQEALELTGFYVIEYFLGGGNALNRSLLDSRTVPFTLHPPTRARNTWQGRMALAPSQWPPHSHPPAAAGSEGGFLGLEPLGRGAFLLASLHRQFQQVPQPSDREALCASLTSSLGLLGAALDPSSVYSPAHAYYTGRAVIVEYYDVECWLGVTAA